MKTSRIVALLCAVGALLLLRVSSASAATDRSSDSTAPRSSTTNVITRSGTKLFLNGKQYKFAGVTANAMVFPPCRGESAFPTQGQLDTFFSQLNPHSMTRIWYLDNDTAFQAAMDRTVASATKFHQYLDVTLTDGDGTCGDPISKTGNFWTSGYTGAYWTHVRSAVGRYKNDAAIGIWEIANEGNGGPTGNVDFYLNTAALIKSIDPLHLVGTGSQPSYAFPSMSAYEKSQSGPNIDFVSVHEYDANTGESAWVNDPQNPGSADIAAAALGKPVYVGEDGFCCGGGDTGSESGNAAKLDAEYKAYLNDPLVAGMIYWNFDFAGTKGDDTIMAFGTSLWNEARTIANPYPGG